MEVYSSDVLILGGGFSAYMAAYTMLKKRKKDVVTIVTPNRGGEAAHELAGMALPRMTGGDTIGQFVQDTLSAGAFQNDPSMVKLLCEESTQVFDRVRSLMEFGPPEEGSRFRPVTGDKKALWKELSETVNKRCSVKEGCYGLRLFIQDGRVQGALCYDDINHAFFAVSAGTVVLATGGYGDLYRENADVKSLRDIGSGIGLAYYAGAEMADLEFIAFQEEGVTSLGGVVIDSQCRTSVPGLLACGGVTAGVHGAGLLKGNAETAALVFGRKAGHTLTRMEFLPGADNDALYKWVNETVFIGQKDQIEAYARIRREIAHTLNTSAGEIRTQEKIEDGLKIIAHLQHELNDLDLCPLRQVCEKMELEFALIAARLTLLASLEREECRGCYKRAVIRMVEKPAEEETTEEIKAEAPAESVPDEAETPESEAGSEEAAEPDEDTAVVCEPPKEPEYEEKIEFIEKEVKPYRVTMKLRNMILMPKKETWNTEA
ncbi:MAG: FAD-binding protein [Clostridia bacterium]|nr:FAD-binding protein [Clostridia bacterium]